jgi:5'-nucleotidase
MKGIPSFAFSTSYRGDFAVAACELVPVIRELLTLPIGENEIWNVNFPGCPLEEYRGILRERTVAPTQLYLDRYAFETQEDGSLLMMNRSLPIPAELAPEGSDVHAVLHGYTSIGRLRCAVL